jgi:hypothetical protein
MNDGEFREGCAGLGVGPDVTLEALERACLKRNLALIRSGTPAEREQLRVLHEKLAAHLKAQAPAAPAGERLAAPDVAGGASRPVPVYVPPPPDPQAELLNPFSFDSWLVNVLAMPLVAGIAWLFSLTPLGGLMSGFHTWMHEFGHATAAWLAGHRALPLPIGWTNVMPEKSLFVYLGVIFLLGMLFTAGWKERKIWPMLIAGAVLPLQFYMSWIMPEHRTDFWFSFCGVGGEFYLSTACMVAFYFQLPEKFKWSICRYVFLFLGASSFLHIWLFWRQVKHGTEGIPWGGMVTGEDDAGGDMNILRDDYVWSNHRIIDTYNGLGTACVAVLVTVYMLFALRVDRPVGRWIESLWPE